MPKPKKKKPSSKVSEASRRFPSEAVESNYWQQSDAAEIDWSRAQRVWLPKLKASTATISLRLPQGMLDELKILANKQDVPYQSLLKVFLAERLAAERRGRRRAP